MSSSERPSIELRLLDEHRRELEVASGIPTDVIAERGYVTITQKAELERKGFGRSQRIVPALLIPLWDVHGELAGYQCKPKFPRIKKGKPLKAIEVLTHTHELLELGETITSIKKTGAKPVKAELNAEDMEIVEATQKEYGFREDAWKMLGVSLGSAGRGAKKKTAKKTRRKKTS